MAVRDDVQPTPLEELLDRTAKEIAAVEVHQGWELSDLLDTGSHVRLRVRRGEGEGRGWRASGEERDVTAAYVIGCDGANSLVRERMGTPLEDLGFAFDWLIADTIPRDPALLAGVNLQQCNPERPTTLVSGGPGRRRWEWMLLPGESAAQIEQPEAVWKLLARSGIGRDDVALERHTVYTFRARWAQRWREGRMLLAGDAAHQMPPFAGQGLCSGIRDVFTLSWQLDLVLKGRADESTLDAYTSERCGHLQHAIAMSVELGKVICISDQNEAAARDELLLGVAADPAHRRSNLRSPISARVSTREPTARAARRRRARCSPRGGARVASCWKTPSPPASSSMPSTPRPASCWTTTRSPSSASCGAHSWRSTAIRRASGSTATGSRHTTARSRSCGPTSTSSGRPPTAAETHTLVHRLRAALIEPDHREERLAS